MIKELEVFIERRCAELEEQTGMFIKVTSVKVVENPGGEVAIGHAAWGVIAGYGFVGRGQRVRPCPRSACSGAGAAIRRWLRAGRRR